MLAVGAALGGVVATVFGRDTAFVVDALSFAAVGAVADRHPALVQRSARAADHEHPKIVEATKEVLHYARTDHRVSALITVKGGFGLAAGVLALIPVFGADVFGEGDIGVGILMAARGVGALVGPFFGHRLSGPQHRRLFSAIGLALAVFGLSYMALGLAPALVGGGRGDLRGPPRAAERSGCCRPTGCRCWFPTTSGAASSPSTSR